MVDAFLGSTQGFALTPFTACGLDAPTGDLTLTPSTHATDGFYMAKITKTEVK